MKNFYIASLLALASSSLFAQVTVTDPWVRATVAHQKATGAFMQLTSKTDARLVAVSSPRATAEIHEMTMQDNVMRMREIPGLDLPAGKTVTLKPGGYHVMFFNLEQPVKEGDTVPLTLVIEDKDRKRQTIELKLPARALTAPASGHSSGH